jgi:hypothetical protein
MLADKKMKKLTKKELAYVFGKNNEYGKFIDDIIEKNLTDSVSRSDSIKLYLYTLMVNSRAKEILEDGIKK